MTETAAAIAAVSAGERKINICSINEMITCKVSFPSNIVLMMMTLL
jgi:hypothetical protein